MFFFNSVKFFHFHKSKILLEIFHSILINENIICRGIRLKDYDIYNPVVRNAFFCISTGKSIPIEQLNDNYCDCIEDGSDEPETNACTNGLFYCSYQKR